MGRAAGSRDDTKRRAILAAAAELLNGPAHATTIAEIARTSGVSRQTIYKHFGSLADVVRAVLAARRDCPLCLRLEEAPPQVSLERYAARLSSWLADAYARSAVRERQGCAAGALALHALAGLDRAAACLAEFLAEESARGRLDVRHAPAAAELFISLVAGRTALAAAGLTAHGAPDEEARACARLFLRAHAPRTASASIRPGAPRRAPVLPFQEERAS